jgi:superfamily II RNA helicase
MSEPPLLRRLPPLGETLTDPDAVLDRFLDYAAEMGLDLYPAQEEALLELCAGKNVILATPTGSGKSLVALALHFKAMCEDKRSFYTSPIKALVNEKFFALSEAFHPDNVGLVTGDATVNRDAPIVCCTAEILANIALRQGARADVGYAVLDEFHYYADRDRGVAWQVPLLTLRSTSFLLMSATLGDTTFFEQKLTELNGAPSATVRSDERPVPLDFAYYESPLHDTVGRLLEEGRAPVYIVSFTQKQCHTEAQSLTSVDVTSREDKRAIAAAIEGERFDTPYGKDVRRLLRHGIGIHHGGMLPRYRRLVERLAQRGLLKVISGTDTLGVGVNIPIRTVLLTKLCKFDGERTRLLGARDFHQICGRAGRKGFDDRGSVVALAPEHVIENLRLEAKAAGDPVKRKRIVRKKPPSFGYVHWDRATFDKLRAARPEPLASRFAVSHAMLLGVLTREEEDGYRAMRELLRRSHERPAVRRRMARTALSMFRALRDAGIVELVPTERGCPRVRTHADLQRDFSMSHDLSLYLYEALSTLDREAEGYALDVLAFAEAILEDPGPVLDKQLDRIKRDKLAELKAAGVEYAERVEELDKLEHPKPNRELIEGTFDAFVERHPWLGAESIRPKGVGRELYELGLDFREYVSSYGLERHEGTLLRYLTDTYKALAQNVPEAARTEALDEMIAFFHGVVRGVDASLLDEWERMRNPEASLEERLRPAPEPEERPRHVTGDAAAFTVLVRNGVFRFVRALAARDYELAATLVEAPPGADPWTRERLEAAFAPYYEEHAGIRTDPKARGTEHTRIDRSDADRWRITQILVDPDALDDWALDLVVDLERSDREGRAVLVFEQIVR